MPQLTERQQHILAAVVREYVERAEPVASAELVAKYRLPYSPATVRNELVALDEAGFLMQPHTSAGRVPTDRGYRFFINHSLEREPARSTRFARLDSARLAETSARRAGGRSVRRASEAEFDAAFAALASAETPAEFLKQASRLMAELTQNAVLAGIPDEDLFYKSGIGAVMQEPEFAEVPLLREFSALLDVLDDEIERMVAARLGERAAPTEPRVFIGRENPIPEARRYSMIISACETPFGKEGVFALIGPTRMDYERNLAVFRSLRELFA